MSKRVRISHAQREILLAFMQEHEKFGRNQITGPNAAQIKKVLLKRLTHQLNSARFAVKKTPDKWLKSWQCWKSDIRAKQLRIKSFNRLKFKPGDEVQFPLALTTLEEKLLLFINGSVENVNKNEVKAARDKRVSLAQQKAMFTFMDTHEELAFNVISGPDREQIRQGYLNELAQKLNIIGPTRKSPEEWFVCWQEWKSEVIGKGRKNKSYNEETSNMDDNPPCPLSALEEQLYQFLDVKMSASGYEDIDEGPLPRERKVTLAQREMMFAFMQEHEKFGRNQISGPNAMQIKKVLLKRLTHQLNSARFAVKKTPDKWLKSWQCWKSDIRAKQSRIKSFNKLKIKLGDEVQFPCPLTKLEEKLLLFVNGSVEHINENETKVSREKRVSLAQQEAMFAFMDTHEELAFSVISGPDREQIRQRYLNELAQKLNLIGPTRKSPEEWFECWQEWKSEVIGKGRKFQSYIEETSNMDDEPPCPLSALEEQVYQFLDVKTSASGDEDIDEGAVLRDKRVTLAQREEMFAFMKTHPDFGKGQITGPNAAKIKWVMLKRLTNQLNSMGPVTKTPDKWLKSWQDWKSDTKAKWYKISHFKLTEAIMHDYVRSPPPLTPLEEELVRFFGFGQMKDTDEHIQTSQDTKTSSKRQSKNKSERTELPALQPSNQKNIEVLETPVPGPTNSQELGLIFEDVFETEIKLESAESSDDNDPLNFEEKHSQSDPHTPEPEPEPEIEKPTHTASTSSRKRRFRRVQRRPISQARLDTMNHLTINEVKKALIEKNAIKKHFYADYMVEIRKQTQALVTIANKLTNR